ncbi:MAG: hypothetical protein KIT33_06800 [Candidatus Kapabacteria bacterium]|nr:hypothetical protein [Candidatus Kapabacteria bacterium]
MPREYQNVIYLDVFFLPDNPQLGWICGYEGKTLRTTDGGISWFGSRIFNQIGMPREVQLESIHFKTELVGYTSGPDLITGFGVIYKTTDGGATWFDITPANVTDLWGTYFLTEDIGLVIGGGCGSSQYFWRTVNGGQTWTSVIYNHPGSKMSDAILYEENGLAYAVGSGTLWKSNNGGRSWLPISNTGGMDWHEEITRVDNTFLIPYSEGCFGSTVTSVGGVRITHDEGRTWSQFNTGAPMFGSFLHDKDRGWGVGFNQTVIYTSDGGKTWVPRNCGIEPGATMDDIWFIDDTTGWVVGSGVYEFYIPNADPPKITSEKGFSICEGDTIELVASEGYDAYIWSSGQTTRSVLVTKPGNYFVRGFIDSICYDGMSEAVNIQFYQRTVPEFLLSSGGQPCKGESAILSLKGDFQYYEWFDGSNESEIEITESGVYSIKLIDSNGCEINDSFEVMFRPNPEPEILNIGRKNFCIGDSVLLFTSEIYSNYMWFKSGSNDVVSINREYWADESGTYYVMVENEYGCVGLSDIVIITVRNETDILEFTLTDEKYFSLDSAYYSQLNCRMLRITNSGNRTYTLEDVYIFKNIAFSTPQSQFPIMIPSGETVMLKVCFSPGRLGENLDSLILADVCTDRLIELLGFGINEGFEDLTKCEVPLIFELNSFAGQSFSFGLGNAVPNPANELVKVQFSSSNNDNVADNMNIRIFNSIGNQVYAGHRILSSKNQAGYINGEIFINTSELLSGLYVIAIEIYGEILTEKFTVFK